jgi:hypothetical protein
VLLRVRKWTAKAWSAYRNLTAAKGLLVSLGLWQDIVWVVAIMAGAIVAWFAALAWWARVLVGLSITALFGITCGAALGHVLLRRVRVHGDTSDKSLAANNAPVISLAYLPGTKPSFRFINDGHVTAFAIAAESELFSQYGAKLVFPTVDRLGPREQMDVVCDLMSWKEDLKDYSPVAMARTDFAFAVNTILEWLNDITANLIISVRHKDQYGATHAARWKLALNKHHEPSLLPL